MATRKPLVLVSGLVAELPTGDSVSGALGGAVSNVISGDTTIAADTSYVVLSYLKVDAVLTVNGNLGII